MNLPEFKKSTKKLAEEEIRKAYEELKDVKYSSTDAEKITQNIERIRRAEALKYGNPRPKLDITKVLEVGLGTLIPTMMVLDYENFKGGIIISKAFSKIKFK